MRLTATLRPTLLLVIGLVIGSIATLWCSWYASGVYSQNQLRRLPSDLAIKGAQAALAGKAEEAEALTRAELLLLRVMPQIGLQTRRWDFDFPFAGPLAKKLTEGMYKPSSKDFLIDQALTEARLADLLERQGKIDEADALFRESAKKAGSNPTSMRQAAETSLNDLAKLQQP